MLWTVLWIGATFVSSKWIQVIDFTIISSQITIVLSDSLYLALSAESLDELIKPKDETEWKVIKQQRFPRPEHKAYDKRTPGMILAHSTCPVSEKV